MMRDALICIRELTMLQDRLCRRLRESFNIDPMLLTLPKHGTLDLDGEFWEFQRHGSGVSFTRPIDGIEVDVPEHIELPFAVDGWRLGTFCEAAGITILTHRGSEYPINEAGIRDLMRVLLLDGHLKPITKSLYSV